MQRAQALLAAGCPILSFYEAGGERAVVTSAELYQAVLPLFESSRARRAR